MPIVIALVALVVTVLVCVYALIMLNRHFNQQTETSKDGSKRKGEFIGFVVVDTSKMTVDELVTIINTYPPGSAISIRATERLLEKSRALRDAFEKAQHLK